MAAFQEATPLRVGELWAIPAMLRLGLIESVRRMALRTVQRLDELEAADRWASRMLDPAGGSSALERFVNDTPKLSAIFVARLLYQLRLAKQAFPAVLWLEQWIGDEGMNAEVAAAQSTQRLAITQIVMANSITSLRAIARMDWRVFVERQAVIEKALREDPAGFYARMTFSTRDHYRHVVERIAKRTRRSEESVALAAVDLARTAGKTAPADAAVGHVGYYLIAEGRSELERITGYTPRFGEAFHRAVLRHPNVIFVGGIVAGTLVALAAVLALLGFEARAAWVAIILIALIPASDIAVAVVNQLVAAFLPPRVLPKLDLREGGVPQEFRTAIVIPTLFGSVRSVHEALENLEVQFLANREAHLHFAVLGDFTDAPTETRDGDTAIIAAAVEGIHALNAQYSGGAQVAFSFFHRPRRWNPQEGVWMGWERKRGKLAEFNRFLRGGAADAFMTVVGEAETLHTVRYVITLDSDTVLPPDAAPLLVGTLAHPLNRAVFDPKLGRVIRGYGILQPRVGVSLPSAHRSRFASVSSGHPGVDPYTTAVSDVYQDLYGEGSFTGKGIYDVDAFEQATNGRFPENTLLSHDLIEGSYARAGLATDINVYDDYPTHYLTHARRKHRWIRGDWQLLKWLTSRVPGPDGAERNRLSVLSRWKITDNLRRSTVEIAQLLFLVVGWTLLPGSPLRWTVLGLGAITAPWIVSLLLAVLRPPLDKSWRAYYGAVGRDAVTSVQQIVLAIAFLPHQAWISADAIGRTLWRVFGSRRHLLEWQSFSAIQGSVARTAGMVWREMLPAVAIAIATGAVIVARALAGSTPPDVMALATLPLVGLWFVAPAIAHALSAPAVRRERRLSAVVQQDAIRYSLLHWRFFDRFVTAESNWLAPDNYQENPSPIVALRTSPTNIGLQLLSTVSAYELGFITVDDLTRRLELTFRSLERMRRFRGHLYNWYDLRDLSVLQPAYISTVDSGNLAGHLIAVRQACLAAIDQPAIDRRTWRALDTALRLASARLETAGAWTASRDREERTALRTTEDFLATARAEVADAYQATDVSATIVRITTSIRAALTAVAEAGHGGHADPAHEWIAWALHLVSEHGLRTDEMTASTMVSRGDKLVPRYPTLREAATTSPGASELSARLEALAARAYDFAMEMDFRFLFDEKKKLFAIGYQQAAHALDDSSYDLLASEARLASFIAIAKNDVPVDHWFHLGRTLTHTGGATALVSWSGSMFEYLMPALVMQSYRFTVLDQTYAGAVRRQIDHGTEHGVPWGVSESAYNVRDRHLTYQYRAFGVPGLALKRGLGRDLVVAPYASALAMLVDAERGLANLCELEKLGALGPYGFRDALDYTRPEPGQRYAIVGTYMAHHIGMGFVALTNVLTGNIWHRHFHADPMVRSAELLLHERIPRRLVMQDAQETRPDEALPDPDLERPAVRQIDHPDTSLPHIALLGRLPYTIMISHCGAGYSRYEDLAVTRWRADGTMDHTGQFCYVKDIGRGHAWSAAHQPMCVEPEWYRAFLATDRVTFHRADDGIETRTEIAVVPEDSAEVRRVTVTNNGDTVREIELTSYGEVVLTSPDADRAHPAFANLFVETEWHEWCTAITATRRPRSAKEQSLWCVHVVDCGGPERVGPVTCETDRARFLGRGRTTRDPMAIERDGPLDGTTGAVLDPIFALRTRVRLSPGQSASVAFTTLVAGNLERAFALADRYHDPHAAQRALDLAWTSTQVELRELRTTPADAAVFQEMAGFLFHGNRAMRAPQAELARNHGSQPLLWASGISGDLPILLAMIESPDGLPTLRQLFSAHRYWRRRGMMVDLVVLNAYPSTYLGELQDKIVEAMVTSGDSSFADRPGGVFVRRSDQLGPDDLLMLRATARVHVPCDGRSLGRIMDAFATLTEPDVLADDNGQSPPRVSGRQTPIASRVIARSIAAPARGTRQGSGVSASGARPSGARSTPPSVQPVRSYANGYGELTADGDYEIRVEGDHVPPAPWANVVANPRGGFIVTERGAGYTWAENSQFFRLTPWHNDPVSDPVSEVLYLRDQDSGDLWTATPAPIRTTDAFTVRHGAGFTTFEHEHDGIAAHLTLGIPEDEPVKLSLLRLTNRGTGPRRLTLSAFAEWTLGGQREHTQHQVHTTFDARHEAILARNSFEPQFAREVAFFAMSERLTGHTGNRREFLGRNGSTAAPAALRSEARLAGTVGAGIDPCAALQCAVTLAPGETKEVVVILGSGSGEAAALASLSRYRDVRSARIAIDATIASWAARLSVITVRTPDAAFDAMVNRWTLYQALACRMWGRSALYQSSGAYGFRDQLQDSMAFVYAEPGVARAHIVRSAGRQFVEGDVQHWWHPPLGRGVRTRFSDDLAWLPYVVDHYVQVSGDRSVLDERAPFLTMRLLGEHEHEVYDLPQPSGEDGTVYEHCLRSLRRACTMGEHGLPLMGIGDWNDGMNRVGVGGRGETVWLAWFLITTLRSFAVHAEQRGDADVATGMRAQADAYLAAIEEHAWDGEWYRRAFFDSGAVLGSAANDECRIDSIAQSWSVISGAGRADRQDHAMASLNRYLVRDDARLLMLLTPAFDKTPHDPGYIKGYLPGVRENGAQYTHAALWAVLATALRGEGDRAFELYQMINPLTHSRTRAEVDIYKVEPYVVAADVYTAAGHLGRGGWTWYTGSASWMYRVGLEAILGFRKAGDTLRIVPCVPADWPEYTMTYRHGESTYEIVVRQALGDAGEVHLDGRMLADGVIPLVDDGARHEVRIVAGRREAEAIATV